MIESFVYGLLATSIMLAINKVVITIFLKSKQSGIGLIYGSMAAKLLFLSMWGILGIGNLKANWVNLIIKNGNR